VSADANGRFLRSFVCGLAVLLGGAALLNRAVDPFGAYGGGVSRHIDEQRFAADSRVGKAELARRYEGSCVILGSSRARIAYDPESAAIPDGPACNLGLAGTNFDEVSRVFRYVAEQPNIRQVLLILDFQQFSSGRTVNADFELSRFNPSQSEFAYQCNLLFNERTSRDSFETLVRAASAAEPRFTELGFDRQEYLRAREFPANLVEKTLRSCLTNSATLRGFQYSPERVAALESLAATCRERDIELIMIMHPVHALQLEALRAAGLWPQFEQWKQDVVLIADRTSHAVWDFTGFHEYAAEPLVGNSASPPGEWNWWWEPSHCRAELGELVLRRVFEDTSGEASFGVRLTADNLATRIQQIRAERGRWVLENEPGVQIVQRVASDAGFEPGTVIVADAPVERRQ